MVSTTNAENLAQDLEADGYRYGAPPWLTRDSIVIDRDACLTSPCEVCGRKPLTYWPFHRAEPPSYVALAVCPCGHAEQF